MWLLSDFKKYDGATFLYIITPVLTGPAVSLSACIIFLSVQWPQLHISQPIELVCTGLSVYIIFLPVLGQLYLSAYLYLLSVVAQLYCISKLV